ncbi:MAG TPA: hypothetical protein PK878_11820 [bacterium]|nr:hypothetical protein [Candidatus Omnitrophota bacterium]HOJ60965.1 hypothetical protein [bacterium]HOL94478.1 hypothetical protein [bacterium]HPO99672.1 hypothetical protein [bacterium]
MEIQKVECFLEFVFHFGNDFGRFFYIRLGEDNPQSLVFLPMPTFDVAFTGAFADHRTQNLPKAVMIPLNGFGRGERKNYQSELGIRTVGTGPFLHEAVIKIGPTQESRYDEIAGVLSSSPYTMDDFVDDFHHSPGTFLPPRGCFFIL